MVRQGASVTPSIGASAIIGCCMIFQKDETFIAESQKKTPLKFFFGRNHLKR
jgi:hypothetical protein